MPSKLDIGYDPQLHPGAARWVGTTTGLVTAALASTALLTLTPAHFNDEALSLLRTWSELDRWQVERQVHLRMLLGALAGATAGAMAYFHAWRRTSMTEPFRQISKADPQVYYGEYARDDLRRRLFEEAGADAVAGLYLAPHLLMPRSAETKNVLVVGAPNSGKSNIIRALADQSIERGDRVLLLCNKGEVTGSFTTDEAVLIAAHHRDSFALDLAADVDDVAAAQQFAADIVPTSSPVFWSDSARSVLTDIIIKLQQLYPGRWNASTLLQAVMSDGEVITRAIGAIVLNAGPLIAGGDEDKAAQGILTTMRSAALVNLRPLAWAWRDAPPERRFSVKRWLKDGKTGPRTVIVQYSSDYAAMSSLVAGSLIRRIAKRMADPRLAVDPARRVVMVLDEFHLLDKIEDLDAALAVGREKGLVAVIGIQAYGQLVDTYGETGANKLLDLFGIKIFGRLSPGDSSTRVVEQLGQREVSALVINRTPGKDDTRRYVEERKTIPTFSAAQLASKLGVFVNQSKTGDVRAVVQCYGQTYILDWPFTIWRRKRPGFVAASWLTRAPQHSRVADQRSGDASTDEAITTR